MRRLWRETPWNVDVGKRLTTHFVWEKDDWRLAGLTRESVELWEGEEHIADAIVVGYVEEALWETPVELVTLSPEGEWEALLDALRRSYGFENVTPGAIYLVLILQVLQIRKKRP